MNLLEPIKLFVVHNYIIYLKKKHLYYPLVNHYESNIHGRTKNPTLERTNSTDTLHAIENTLWYQ